MTRVVIASPIICLLLFAHVGGCRDARRPTVPKITSFTAFVGASQDDPLWPVLKTTARKYWDRSGELPGGLRVVAPRTRSVDAQVRMIRALRDDGMIALCVQVIDPEAIAPLLESLSSAGIVVVTMGAPVESSRAIPHSGWEERRLAERVVEVLLDRSPSGGPVTMLLPPVVGTTVHQGPAERLLDEQIDMFKQIIRDYPTYQIVDELRWKPGDIAGEVFSAGMGRFPTMRAWVSFGNEPLRCDMGESWSAGRAVRGLRDALVIGVDPLPNTWCAIESSPGVVMIGTEYGDIAPRALIMSQSLRMKSGQFVSSSTLPLIVVTRENLPAFKTQWSEWTTP